MGLLSGDHYWSLLRGSCHTFYDYKGLARSGLRLIHWLWFLGGSSYRPSTVNTSASLQIVNCVLFLRPTSKTTFWNRQSRGIGAQSY